MHLSFWSCLCLTYLKQLESPEMTFPAASFTRYPRLGPSSCLMILVQVSSAARLLVLLHATETQEVEDRRRRQLSGCRVFTEALRLIVLLSKGRPKKKDTDVYFVDLHGAQYANTLQRGSVGCQDENHPGRRVRNSGTVWLAWLRGQERLIRTRWAKTRFRFGSLGQARQVWGGQGDNQRGDGKSAERGRG